MAGTCRLCTCAFFGVPLPRRADLAYGVIRMARAGTGSSSARSCSGRARVAGRWRRTCSDHPEYGLTPEGMLDDDPLLRETSGRCPCWVATTTSTDVVLERAVDLVIVTFGSLREHAMVPLLRACDRLACEILFVPRLFEVHAVTKDTEVLWGMPLVRLRRAPFRTRGLDGKRVLATSSSRRRCCSCCSAPFFSCACSALARWETGCVLFRQTRVGLDGRPFTLLKFCSLPTGSEAGAQHTGTSATTSGCGPIGRLLRRTSLDELPAAVERAARRHEPGGSPPRAALFVDEFARQFPWYMARHRVPVGLPGWAQVHGLRGDTSIADRARFDNFYIENWSMWGDIKILLRTAAQVLRAAGR